MLFLPIILNYHLITADTLIKGGQIDVFDIHSAISGQILQVLLPGHKLVRLTVALTPLRLVVFGQIDLHDLNGAVIALYNVPEH